MFKSIGKAIEAYRLLRTIKDSDTKENDDDGKAEEFSLSFVEEYAELVRKRDNRVISMGAFSAVRNTLRERSLKLQNSIVKRIESLEELKVKLEKYRSVLFFGGRVDSILKEIDRLIVRLNNIRTSLIAVVGRLDSM